MTLPVVMATTTCCSGATICTRTLCAFGLLHFEGATWASRSPAHTSAPHSGTLTNGVAWPRSSSSVKSTRTPFLSRSEISLSLATIISPLTGAITGDFNREITTSVEPSPATRFPSTGLATQSPPLETTARSPSLQAAGATPSLSSRASSSKPKTQVAINVTTMVIAAAAIAR